MKRIGLIMLASMLVLLCFPQVSRADILLSVGYYDLAPPAGGNTNALPNPWLGSPGVTFLGSASQANPSGDPDESAVLIQNTGASTITLDQGFKIVSGANTYQYWDSLIGAGGTAIGAGDYVILTGTSTNGLDGSDIGLSDSTITFIINGITHTAVDDSCSSCAGNSVLEGSNIGSANETEPWTQIDDIGGGNGSVTPEPASFALMGTGLLALGVGLARRNALLSQQQI